MELTYMPKWTNLLVVMVFEGYIVDLLVEACPQYKRFVHTARNGKKLLYVRLKRALYGCIKSALLWWRTLTETLFKEGFRLNPYDSGVANKILPDGTQITICCYVDDLKISCVNKDAVMEIIENLEDRYGVMRKSLGDKHNYLGMDVEFRKNGTVKILMQGHLENAVEDFGEDLGKAPKTPASARCFELDPRAPCLPEPKRKKFHSIVQKLLYVSKRV